MRHQRDQPLGLESLERLPQRYAADTELGGKGHLAERLAGGELAAQDPITEGLGSGLGEGTPGG